MELPDGFSPRPQVKPVLERRAKMARDRAHRTALPDRHQRLQAVFDRYPGAAEPDD